MKKFTLPLLVFILMVLSLWISYDRIKLIQYNHQMMSYWIADYSYVQSVEKLHKAISQGRSVYFAPGTYLVLREPIENPSGTKDMTFTGGNLEAAKDFPKDRAMIEFGRK